LFGEDRLDAQWIARLAEMGLLRPSFVPPPEIRALRDLTRTRVQLVRGRTRAWQRPEKLLEGALIKLSSAVSRLARAKTARNILEALAGGQHDPKTLAAMAAGQVKGGRAAVEQTIRNLYPACLGVLGVVAVKVSVPLHPSCAGAAEEPQG
jgi:transposase